MPAAPTTRRSFGGADVFTLVLDREIRRAGFSGFNSYALLTLASRPDVDALRAALAADTPFARRLRAPVRGVFPFLLPFHDDVRTSPPPRVDVLHAPPAEGAPWPSLLNARLHPGRGENLRFTLFPERGADGAERWRLAFLFSHLLADAKAAERILALLASGAVDAASAAPRALVDGMGFGEIARTSRDVATDLEKDAADGVHVVARARRGGERLTGYTGAVAAFDAEQTAAAVAAGRKAAGYAMEGLWYLACLLAADRDTDPEPPAAGARYVVPLPTNLDRKGEAGRAFGNHLVFLFVSAPSAEAHDPVRTARTLRDHVMRHLKEKGDVRAQAQLDFCKRLPLGVHAHLARRSLRGTWGSLFFTNPGPVAPSLTSFFGAPVLDFEHYPIPSPDPGLCGAVWTFGDRLRLGTTWLRGRIPDDRARALLARWRARVVERPS